MWQLWVTDTPLPSSSSDHCLPCLVLPLDVLSYIVMENNRHIFRILQHYGEFYGNNELKPLKLRKILPNLSKNLQYNDSMEHPNQQIYQQFDWSNNVKTRLEMNNKDISAFGARQDFLYYFEESSAILSK